ncbi:ABC transporter ATP-binding protein [Leucobacter luti]|uniref:ABC transporter ATP-binding protein n=1 Tax=Leucobacter luti TaxID=340320 RepID=UPI003CFFC024
MMVPGSPRLAATAVHAGYGARDVLTGVDFAVPDRAVTAVIGPNGSGKSTLLKVLGRTLVPTRGHVALDGIPAGRIPPKRFARTVATLPQAPMAPDGIRVVDLVARGRQPHQSWLRQWSPQDEAAVRTALELTDTSHLAEHPIDSLSGGQRQRVWVAFVVAQDAEILLLDEPTTFLDLAHAIDVLRLVGSLHTERGRTVVMVLHDLNLAARVAQHLVVMDQGAIVAQGAPREVLTAELLGSVFRLDAAVVDNPVADGVLVVPGPW